MCGTPRLPYFAEVITNYLLHDEAATFICTQLVHDVKTTLYER